MDNAHNNNQTETSKAYYVGIGVRSTPADIQSLMTQMAQALSGAGVILRSGHTPGAMQAFEAGAGDQKEIFVPYTDFANSAGYQDENDIVPLTHAEHWDEAVRIATKYHSRWDSYTELQQRFLIRNVFIVLGADLRTPAEFMICYSHDVALGDETSHAIKIATKVANMPIFNLAVEGDFERLMTYMEQRG